MLRIFIFSLVTVSILYLIFDISYKRCPLNKILVITNCNGKRKYMNRNCFIIPFLQTVDYLSLSDFSTHIITEVFTNDYIKLNFDINIDICMNKSFKEDFDIHASNFLNYETKDIRNFLSLMLESIFRDEISKIEFKELKKDKLTFIENLTEKTSFYLSRFGLRLKALNILNILTVSPDINLKESSEYNLNEITEDLVSLIEKIKSEREYCLEYKKEIFFMPEEKELFKGIIESLCELYSNEDFKEEIDDLSEKFDELDIDFFFSWLDKDNKDFFDIDFNAYKSREKYVFDAEIDLTCGNSAPYKVLRYEGDILKLVETINELSPVLGYVLFDIK